jgi:eukaryotic-like serine/threonine-protein kinase
MSMRLMSTGVPRVGPEREAAPAPTRLGRYTLLGPLGEGAMGLVHRAHDPLLDREVALKTFRCMPADVGIDAALRLRNEAQAAARLSHPGIVAVYEYGEDGAQSFIAMELVRGRPLLCALAPPQPLPIDDVMCVMVQLLTALQCAHEQGVWHRDIKPSNLMITQDGRLKITDFGVARIDDAASAQRERGVIGSPGYLAPECYQRDQAVDQRADLYACGVLLFELLTGARPYRGSPDVVMFKTLHLPVPPLAAPGDAQFVHLSRFAHVVQRALAKSPHERYASAVEMREALTLAAGRSVPHALSAPTLQRLLRASANDASGPPVLRDVLSDVSSATSKAQTKAPTTDAAALPPRMLHDAQRLLAHRIGPIAALLVRRAAAGATTRERFIARLVSFAAHGREREALLAALVKLDR